MATAEEQAFIARVGEHIDLSNTQARSAPGQQVSMSALYAAARYCAWMCRGSNASGEQMTARRGEAMTIFGQQFATMFGDCYDEYARDFTSNAK